MEDQPLSPSRLMLVADTGMCMKQEWPCNACMHLQRPTTPRPPIVAACLYTHMHTHTHTHTSQAQLHLPQRQRKVAPLRPELWSVKVWQLHTQGCSGSCSGLTSLRLTYGMRSVGMNYDKSLFGIRLSDCRALAHSIQQVCATLRFNLVVEEDIISKVWFKLHNEEGTVWTDSRGLFTCAFGDAAIPCTLQKACVARDPRFARVVAFSILAPKSSMLRTGAGCLPSLLLCLPKADVG